MAEAIWIIMYDLDPEREAEYLNWFHDIHIPEKLARPGYSWAAHYRARGHDGPADKNRYIALFGGETSAVFYDPSPAQIKPTQNAETRDMMSCRSNPASLIVAEEWSQTDISAGDGAIQSDHLTFTACDAPGRDEAFGAWLVQDYRPSLGASGLCKYLASTGGAKHVITVFDADGNWPAAAPDYLEYPLGPSLAGDRIWPPHA